IVDMKKSQIDKGKWISALLQKKVTQYLSEDKQVMLFLNRRGYAPITLCKSCGHKEVCKDCATFLVAHKGRQKLICHYCGYSKNIEADCSACDEKGSLINCGPGVERIADEVKLLWPNVKSIIVTRDTVSQDTQADILNQITSKDAKIIIGTQILSKGHHFPSLDLVGIIDADIGLFGADLRASEKTFQLLTQVSGRAGRENNGEVVIQTYYPDNPILSAIKEGNRKEFYELEVDSRRNMNMPPFARLVSIIISGKNEKYVKDFSDSLSRVIDYDKKIVVLGPVIAPMSFVRGRFRYRFLVKSAPGIKVQAYISRWLSKNSTPGSLRLKIDVDPYNFM
ncbi:MAG: primosomal protein N', partial [Alphaproteobacteria bacterium]|nr:primosomal protein N' [Alphaproteobacteria bacterium]